MPGGSSMLSMIQKLRDNASMRRERGTYFKNKNAYSSKIQKLHKTYRQLSDDEKQTIRKQIKKEKTHNIYLTIGIGLVTCVLVYMIVTYVLKLNPYSM